MLFTDQISSVYGGEPVELPNHSISYLSLGSHFLRLRVSDGVNETVQRDIQVEIVDTTVPTLAPVPNLTILWPPNHQMKDIYIDANAADNLGYVLLSAMVFSNEPEAGIDVDDLSPDWTEPIIDQENGIISLQLRSERSGSGDGRIYTISISAADQSGNNSTIDIEIIVPHDKRKK